LVGKKKTKGVLRLECWGGPQGPTASSSKVGHRFHPIPSPKEKFKHGSEGVRKLKKGNDRQRSLHPRPMLWDGGEERAVNSGRERSWEMARDVQVGLSSTKTSAFFGELGRPAPKKKTKGGKKTWGWTEGDEDIGTPKG